MCRVPMLLVLFLFGGLAVGKQPESPPRLRTLELFPEDYAGKTFTYKVWIFFDGINKDKDSYVIQFREGVVLPAEGNALVGHTTLRTNKLNFLLTKDQAKALCQEFEEVYLYPYRAYELEFTIQKEQGKGGYPIARIVSLKKVAE